MTDQLAAHDRSVVYHHLPCLVVSTRSVDVLGGCLQRFSFDDFARLDGDWAAQRYFDRTVPSVWRKEISQLPLQPGLETRESIAIDPWEKAIEQSRDQLMLLYLALISTTLHPLPDPRLSISYVLLPDGGLSRTIGPLERTFLLNGRTTPEVTRSQMEEAIRYAEFWYKEGLSHNQSLFTPLRALSTLALLENEVERYLYVLPLVASLEGYLAPGKQPNKPRRMAEATQVILKDRVPADLRDFFKRLYAWRSAVLHGRPADLDINLYDRVRSLTARIVCAATEVIIEHDLDRDDVPGSLATLQGK